jgi:hypothetical protein
MVILVVLAIAAFLFVLFVCDPAWGDTHPPIPPY